MDNNREKEKEVILAQKLTSNSESASDSMRDLPKVSVVVTTRNNESQIARCLQSIVHQKYSNLEPIVVDNSSSDKTKDIARKYTEKVYDLGPERSAQRNFGLNKASGEYLLWIDSDMILDNTVVSACVDFAENHKDPVAIVIDEVVLGTKFYQGVRRFENTLLRGSVVEAARFFSKNLFEQTDRFDENITGGEDWDLTNQLRKFAEIKNLEQKNLNQSNENSILDSSLLNYVKSCGVNPNLTPVIYHDDQISFQDKLEKRSYYSEGYKRYLEKWNDSEIIKRQLSPISRFTDMFTARGNLWRILAHPVKFLALVGSKAWEFVLTLGSKS